MTEQPDNARQLAESINTLAETVREQVEDFVATISRTVQEQVNNYEAEAREKAEANRKRKVPVDMNE